MDDPRLTVHPDWLKEFRDFAWSDSSSLTSVSYTHLIYQHYRLFTYDDVYNIIAVSYEFAAEL